MRQSDMAERLAEALASAVEEYLGEHDTPAKDYAYRATCRERMRKALAAYRASKEGK